MLVVVDLEVGVVVVVSRVDELDAGIEAGELEAGAEVRELEAGAEAEAAD
jgi:hypothetical protein